MQPSSPTTPGQYDFILNPNAPQAPKSKLPIPINTSSPKGKIMLVVGGGVLLIVVLLLGASVLGGSGDSAGDTLLTVLQEQTELIRVADQAKNNARQANTRNLATNVTLTVSSAEQQILPLAKKRGAKVEAKQLGAKQNSTTDKTLKAAGENGQFDSVFTQALATQLTAYQESLGTAYKQVSNAKDKQVIKSAYDGAGLLVGVVQSN